MSVLDLPPGIGLLGAPLGIFSAPRHARRLAAMGFVLTIVVGLVTWYLASRQPWRRGTATLLTLPLAFMALAAVGFAVRTARVTITRDGVRWGWTALGFHQPAARIAKAHVYRDGVALEARRGSWWFLGRRDWDRFEALVRQLKRTDLPFVEYPRAAPLRARLQSYGRFLDLMVIGAAVGAVVMLVKAS